MFSEGMYQCGTVSEVLLLERIEGSEISEAKEVIQLLSHRRKEGPGFLGRLDCFTHWLAHMLHDLGSGKRDVSRACWGSGRRRRRYNQGSISSSRSSRSGGHHPCEPCWGSGQHGMDVQGCVTRSTWRRIGICCGVNVSGDKVRIAVSGFGDRQREHVVSGVGFIYTGAWEDNAHGIHSRKIGGCMKR